MVPSYREGLQKTILFYNFQVSFDVRVFRFGIHVIFNASVVVSFIDCFHLMFDICSIDVRSQEAGKPGRLEFVLYWNLVLVSIAFN